ncbi:MAG: FMN-binding protein [Alphaproteobacteria bacterium]|nr:MAG: FMN-binding protein [Alphaproteobacteria bacterium]
MRLLLFILFSIPLLSPALLWAKSAPVEENYLKAEDYISAALGRQPEKPGIIWITKDIKPHIRKILRKKVFPLRYRYYRHGNRTVWILNVVGRTMPITTGITIEDSKIIDLTVLTYRESRGSEIRFPAYSNQFNNVELDEKLRLSKPINGISGATMSTNAMKKASRLALYLHNKVLEENVPQEQK